MFTFAKVAGLANLQPVTLRMWFERGHFALQPDDQDAVQGGVRYLSDHTALAVCIAAAFTRLGVPISRAVIGGMAFAHTEMGHPRRKFPGALYEGPVVTLIGISGDKELPKIFCLG